MRLTPAPVSTEEAQLRAWLRRFSTDRPRWGWRRAAKMARRAGWQANNKRIRRLWREEGLRVPQRRRQKRLTGIGVAVGAMSPIRPNVIWAMDFQCDTDADGRTLKMLNVIDEFTREALAIEVDRRIDADGVVDVLDRLAFIHGAPHYVRFDNGCACGSGSEVSRRDLLEHVDVESLIGDQLLEPGVLGFELLEPFGLVGLHTAVLGHPAMPRRLGGLQVTADLSQFLACPRGVCCPRRACG